MTEIARQLQDLTTLRDSGLITQDDFEKQKLLLLGGNQTRPTARKRGFWVSALAISVIAGVAIFGKDVLSIQGSPTCDSPDVVRKALSLVNEELKVLAALASDASGAPFLRMDGLVNARQIHADKDLGFRACTARYKNNPSKGVGYTVEWQDKSNGTFAVTLVPVKALLERYSTTDGVDKSNSSRALSDSTETVSTPVTITAPIVADSKPSSAKARVLPSSSSVLGNYTPSFKCESAGSTIEKMICTDRKISQLDGLLAATYHSRLTPEFGADGTIMQKEQREWIRHRNQCSDISCIERAYRARITELCEMPVISGVHFDSDCDEYMRQSE